MDAKELISEVRRLEIRTRKIVEEICGGAYHSRFKGRGIEFEEVREYIPGDDVRDIDWNVTARLGSPFIKKYIEERELHVLLATDVSSSMLYGSEHKTKMRASAELSALIALSAIRNHDKVGMVKFTDTVEKQIPMRSGRTHVLRLIRELVGTAPNGSKTNLANLFTHLRQSLKKRAVIFVLSDFLDEVDTWITPLKMLAKKHDVILINITDPAEKELPVSGLWNLSDSENDQCMCIFSGEGFKTAYNTKAEEESQILKTQSARAKVGLITVDTKEDLVKPLMRYFNS